MYAYNIFARMHVREYTRARDQLNIIIISMCGVVIVIDETIIDSNNYYLPHAVRNNRDQMIIVYKELMSRLFIHPPD